MTDRMKKFTLLSAAWCLAFLLCFCASLSAEEALPQPGEMINSSNIAKYKHLFPDFFHEAFTTGWDLLDPFSITVRESKSNPIPKPFLEASEKNRGKYSVDSEGYVTGGPFEGIVGVPFPDIDPGDPDFAQKFMWNYDYRYRFDDQYYMFTNFSKRRGDPLMADVVEAWHISFQNRMFDDPKPLYKTRTGLRSVHFLKNLQPPVQRNFITNLIRYTDQRLQDTTYLYLPTMRRVLRGEAGERSTPIMSSTQAPDDFYAFDGRIAEFTYKFVEERKVIALADAKVRYPDVKGKKFSNIPVEQDNWMVKDVYVIDITPKDPKYPQSKKQIWCDKETTWAYYAASWDRAGALWKVWQLACNNEPLPSGGTVPYFTGMLGVDTQLGYAVQMVADWKLNGNGLTENDVSVSAMRRKGR